jgi:CrcB protein
MSGMWMYLALGGFSGAICRYMIIRLISIRFSTAFPYGTLTVNVLGSFALGLMLGSNMDEDEAYIYASLGIGFLGSFTTFSTYALESLELSQKKRWKSFIMYQLASYCLTVTAAAIGFICVKRFA